MVSIQKKYTQLHIHDKDSDNQIEIEIVTDDSAYIWITEDQAREIFNHLKEQFNF